MTSAPITHKGTDYEFSVEKAGADSFLLSLSYFKETVTRATLQSIYNCIGKELEQ